MRQILINGVSYSDGCSGSDQIEELTLAEYNALQSSKLTDGITYYIKDIQHVANADRSSYDNENSGLVADDVQSAIDEIDGINDDCFYQQIQ